MAQFVRKFTKRVFIISTILVVFFFLLACLNPFLNPHQWWFIALMGLAFPFLLVLVIASVMFWLVFRSRWTFLPLAALIVAFTNVRALIAFNYGAEFNTTKDSNSIRILTWNVMWFDEQTKADKSQKSQRKEMLEFINQQNADILCFQEFLEPNKDKKTNYSNIKDIVKLGYPYHYWVKDHEISWGVYYSGAAIFSKYPIVDTVRIQYEGSTLERAAESLIAADVNVNGKLLRVYNTHLRSNLFRKNDYRNLEIIRNAEDSILEASRSIIRKLREGYKFRGNQAELVRSEVDNSPHPEVICGDFNDIPNSYTYFTIKGARQDAFINGGSGIGRTFSTISPTLRIDYILASKKFSVNQARSVVLPYSDHYPVMTDLRWKE